MKKLLFTLLLIVFIMPITVFAEEHIEIKSIELLNKSENTVINNEASTDGEKINLDITFYDVDDYATYKVVVKNNSDKSLFINDNIFKNDNEHVSYRFSYDDGNNFVKPGNEKVVNIKISYSTEVEKTLFQSAKYDASNKNPLVLSDKMISVPNTLKNLGILGILIISFVGICIAVGLLSLYKNNKIKPINMLLILLLFLLVPKYASALLQVEIPIDSKITIKNVKPNYCYFDGNLTQGTQYINGQYTYRYKQTYYSSWSNINDDGWGVTLTDKESTDPVTTPLCTYINDKPVVSMTDMFYYSKTTSIDLSSFDTSNVVNMDYMFEGTSNVTELDLSTFDTSKNRRYYKMFKGMESLQKLDLRYFDFYSGRGEYNSVDTSCLVQSDRELTEINLTGVSFAKNVDFYNMGINDTKVTKLDLSNCKFYYSMDYMFSNLSKVEEITFNNADTSNVTIFNSLFRSSHSLKKVDISSFDITHASPSNTDLTSLFYDTTGLEYLNISNLDFSNGASSSIVSRFSLSGSTNLKTIVAKNIKLKGSAAYAFSGFPALEEIILDGADTSEVTDMSYMFYNSRKIKKLDLSSFDTSNVTTMDHMFDTCDELEEVDVSSFDTLKSSDNLYHVFYNDYKLKKLDLSNFLFRGVSTRTVQFTDKLTEIITPVATSNQENFLPSGYLYDDEYNNYNHLTLVGPNVKLTRIDDKHVIRFVPCGGIMDKTYRLQDLDDNSYGTLPVPTREGRTFKGWSLSFSHSYSTYFVENNTNFSLTANGDSYYPKNIVLYAYWEHPDTFLKGGVSLNTKIKSIASGLDITDSSYPDNLIKHIKRAKNKPNFEFTEANVISDYSSANKVYAWFDTDTLYIYSDSEKIYLNEYSGNAFMALKGLVDFDFSIFDFSDVIEGYNMFKGCSSIERFDLTKADFSSLRDSKNMFTNCTNLKYIDFSNIDFLYLDANNMFKDSPIKEFKAGKIRTVNTPSYFPYDKNGSVFFVDENGLGFRNISSGMKQGKTYKSAFRIALMSNYYTYVNGDYVMKAIDTIFVPYDNNKSIELPIPTRDNYKFLGWTYNNNYLENNMLDPVNSDIFLYAQWEAIQS